MWPQHRHPASIYRIEEIISWYKSSLLSNQRETERVHGQHSGQVSTVFSMVMAELDTDSPGDPGQAPGPRCAQVVTEGKMPSSPGVPKSLCSHRDASLPSPCPPTRTPPSLPRPPVLPPQSFPLQDPVFLIPCLGGLAQMWRFCSTCTSCQQPPTALSGGPCVCALSLTSPGLALASLYAQGA